jgi:PTS system galactitol-specific IIC component
MHEELGEEQDIYVGMDCALGTGDPTAITAALIMIPITIGLAFIIPGNQFFPIGMMGSLAYMTAICAMETEGNLLHTVIVCSLYMVFTMLALNFLADLGTAFIGTTVDLKGAQAVGSSLHNIPDILLGIIGKILGLL